MTNKNIFEVAISALEKKSLSKGIFAFTLMKKNKVYKTRRKKETKLY